MFEIINQNSFLWKIQDIVRFMNYKEFSNKGLNRLNSWVWYKKVLSVDDNELIYKFALKFNLQIRFNYINFRVWPNLSHCWVQSISFYEVTFSNCTLIWLIVANAKLIKNHVPDFYELKCKNLKNSNCNWIQLITA